MRRLTVVALHGRLGPSARYRWWRGWPEASRSFPSFVSWHGWPQAADDWYFVLRFWTHIRSGHLQPAEESAGAPLDARSFRTHLRNLQDVPHHAGQIPSLSLVVHRRHYRTVFRRPLSRAG